ncbi:MAG: EF-hand protein [Betaproteobacteria bacterium]|nr:EF-hand protein [Betaproteobacteria bacterium]
MRKALIVLSFSSLGVLPMVACAQTDAGGNSARGEKMRAAFEQRFTKADANGDGKLSKTEAQAMPRVAKNFDSIDADHDGFVTKAEIGQAMMAQRAAKGGGQ